MEGLQPIDVKIREGLALMNGTSVMTGIGIVNVLLADKLIEWSLQASCMINEIVQAYDDHLSTELNNAKLHNGQQIIAKKMRDHLQNSQLIRNRQEHLDRKSTRLNSSHVK